MTVEVRPSVALTTLPGAAVCTSLPRLLPSHAIYGRMLRVRGLQVLIGLCKVAPEYLQAMGAHEPLQAENISTMPEE